jgi:Helix-turn-helix domain
VYTCRHALLRLAAEGVLVKGPSPNSRFRVAGASPGPGFSEAGRALSAGLSGRRRAAGLRQEELAAIIGYSLTSVGHAETGRLWQSRDWWQLTDKALDADGALVALHDAYLISQATPEPGQPPAALSAPPQPAPPAPSPGSAFITSTDRHAVRSVVITWGDGDVTIINLPAAQPGPPASAQEQEISDERL